MLELYLMPEHFNVSEGNGFSVPVPLFTTLACTCTSRAVAGRSGTSDLFCIHLTSWAVWL